MAHTILTRQQKRKKERTEIKKLVQENKKLKNDLKHQKSLFSIITDTIKKVTTEFEKRGILKRKNYETGN